MRYASTVAMLFVALAVVVGAADDPETDAFVDNILSSDPMHTWVREQTDDLKKQIRTGDMQKIYARFFVDEG